MGSLSNLPKWRNLNRTNNSVTAVNLHNHPQPPPVQFYHQEISKTRQDWPTSTFSAFSTNDVRRATMTQSKSTDSSLPLPPQTYPAVSPPLVQTESALICGKSINSNQDRTNCVCKFQPLPPTLIIEDGRSHSCSWNAQGYIPLDLASS